MSAKDTMNTCVKINTYGSFGYWYFYYVPAFVMHKTLERLKPIYRG